MVWPEGRQAAEKALKAALQSVGAEAWGHATLSLIDAVVEATSARNTAPPDAATIAPLRDAARQLDRYYVPARYPNGYASGKPGDYIVEEDADRAQRSAAEIVRFCHRLLARS